MCNRGYCRAIELSHDVPNLQPLRSRVNTKKATVGPLMTLATLFLLLRFERDVIEFIAKLQNFSMTSRIFIGCRVAGTIWPLQLSRY